jgi:hypothetical protein
MAVFREETEMFTRITTDVAQIQRNRVEKLQFYSADVKAFDHPIVVLPDVGGPPNSYIMVKCVPYVGQTKQAHSNYYSTITT